VPKDSTAYKIQHSKMQSGNIKHTCKKYCVQEVSTL